MKHRDHAGLQQRDHFVSELNIGGSLNRERGIREW